MADEVFASLPGAQTYPPGWHRWVVLKERGKLPPSLGMQCRHEHLNRFAARYRLAKAFHALHLRGYNAATIRSYSALFRVFLVWSAFEQYLKALPCPQEHCLAPFGNHVPPGFLDTIRSADENGLFFSFIHARTIRANKREVGRYLAGDAINVTYLASSIRHVFAHGVLSAHAGKQEAERVAAVASTIAEVHLTGVGADFAARVEACS